MPWRSLTVGGVSDANVEENAAYTGNATLGGGPIGSVTWELSGDDGSLFTLSNQSVNRVTVTLTARDFEDPDDADKDNVYEYTLTATDLASQERLRRRFDHGDRRDSPAHRGRGF